MLLRSAISIAASIRRSSSPTASGSKDEDMKAIVTGSKQEYELSEVAEGMTTGEVMKILKNERESFREKGVIYTRLCSKQVTLQ